MKKSKRTENAKGIIDDLKGIAALFGVEFPEKEEDLIEDISSIKQNQEEIIIRLSQKSYLREIIDSWKLTERIGGLGTTEQKITIMLTKKQKLKLKQYGKKENSITTTCNRRRAPRDA